MFDDVACIKELDRLEVEAWEQFRDGTLDETEYRKIYLEYLIREEELQGITKYSQYYIALATSEYLYGNSKPNE